jgi:hypothetical protein
MLTNEDELSRYDLKRLIEIDIVNHIIKHSAIK